MSRESLLIILGIVIMASPFLGIPLALLMWFYLAAGFLVAVIGATLRVRTKRRPAHEAHTPIVS